MKSISGRGLERSKEASNKQISTIRSRIEHVFGFIEGALGGSIVRSIAMIRAKFNITLTFLVYNICRLGQLTQPTTQYRLSARFKNRKNTTCGRTQG